MVAQSKKKKRRKRKSKAKTNVAIAPTLSLTSQQPAVAGQSGEKNVVPIDAQHDKVPATTSTNSGVIVHPSPSVSSQSSSPISQTESPSQTGPSSCNLNLGTCTDIHYESREGVHGILYRSAADGEQEWTPVVGKRKKRGRLARLKFPRDHPLNQVNPSSVTQAQILTLMK